MRNKILAALAVVCGLAVVGAMVVRPTTPQSFEPYKPVDFHHANILTGLENHVKMGSFRRIDIHPTDSYAVVWVDESFLDKPFSFQENSAKVGASALFDLGRDRFASTVDIKLLDTEKTIGRYSWESLKLY
jgi:hypothetical protein